MLIEQDRASNYGDSYHTIDQHVAVHKYATLQELQHPLLPRRNLQLC